MKEDKAYELYSRFITEDIIEKAISHALIVLGAIDDLGKDFHIIIVGPKSVMLKCPPPLNYEIKPHVYHEQSFGDRKNWRFDFEKIARSKVMQLWNCINPGGSHLNPPSHLLVKEDTPFWGGDKMEGLVCACSGLPPYYDKMVSRIILSSLIAHAHELWIKSEYYKGEFPFLS